MAPVKRVYGPGELAAFVAGGGPATDDDVSITNDGRRLDSAEAALGTALQTAVKRADEQAFEDLHVI